MTTFTIEKHKRGAWSVNSSSLNEYASVLLDGKSWKVVIRKADYWARPTDYCHGFETRAKAIEYAKSWLVLRNR